MSSLKAYKYRLYPKHEQGIILQGTLDKCRELSNAALQERRDAYEIVVRRHPNFYDEDTRRELSQAHAVTYATQSAQLPEIKDLRPEFGNIHSQVLQDVLRRVQKSFDGFFRRIKEGQTPGYPRFQAYGRYDSFTFPQMGFSLTEDHRVCLSKIGTIKLKMPKVKGDDGRKVPYLPAGQMKTCTLKREGTKWFVVFSCEVETALVYHPSEEATGLDMGLLHFATLADGSTIENPRHFRVSAGKLKRQQQALARKKRGSKRRRKAAMSVAKTHRHIRNQRKDFHHKEARKLVSSYQTIVFEKLQPTNMSRRPKPKQDEETGVYLPNGAAAKAGLNKSIMDAGWSQFQQMCVNKAEWAGSRVLFVSPQYTSQICCQCGTIVKKTLDERWHTCECGCSLDRDHNSAIVILVKGLATGKEQVKHPRRKPFQARTEPSGDA